MIPLNSDELKIIKDNEFKLRHFTIVAYSRTYNEYQYKEVLGYCRGDWGCYEYRFNRYKITHLPSGKALPLYYYGLKNALSVVNLAVWHFGLYCDMDCISDFIKAEFTQASRPYVHRNLKRVKLPTINNLNYDNNLKVN